MNTEKDFIVTLKIAKAGAEYEYQEDKNGHNTDIYRTPNEDSFAFKRKDGARVFVRNRIHTWVASRMYGGIVINYQYLKSSLGFSETDEFAMQFVNKKTVSQE